MKIHVYSIMRNEEFLLPYFLRHYARFAERIFIINDHSTDKTVTLSKAHPKVTLLEFPYTRGLNEDDFNTCLCQSYKTYSREADWVMCVDGDEFIYHPDIIGNLTYQQKRGVQIIKTTGYSMFSEQLPQTSDQIYTECRQGIRERRYDKPIVFDPKLDIVFAKGRHTIAHPEEIRPRKGKLALLHYRYISREYFLKRTRHNLARIEMTDALRTYLIDAGAKFYDRIIKTDLQNVV